MSQIHISSQSSEKHKHCIVNSTLIKSISHWMTSNYVNKIQFLITITIFDHYKVFFLHDWTPCLLEISACVTLTKSGDNHLQTVVLSCGNFPETEARQFHGPAVSWAQFWSLRIFEGCSLKTLWSSDAVILWSWSLVVVQFQFRDGKHILKKAVNISDLWAIWLFITVIQLCHCNILATINSVCKCYCVLIKHLYKHACSQWG